MGKLFLAIGGFFAALLLASVIASAAQGERFDPAAYARAEAEAERVERAAQIDATLAPLDLVLAAAWRLLPLGAALLILTGATAWGSVAVIRFRRERHADERGLLPVAAADQHTARAALAGFHAARLEEARRPAVPHALTWSPHYSHRVDALGAADAPVAQLSAPNVPTFAALLDGGRVGRGQPLLLGHDLETGEGVWGDWRDLYSAGLGGKQGSGKSWTAASLISQSLLGGARVIIGDPHAGDAESLITRLEPLLPAVELTADDDRAILESARYAHDEFQRRKAAAKAHQPYDQRPVILVIDEWTSLLRGELGDELPPLLAALTTEGRKYGVNALLLAQRWEAAAAGGSDVRNTLTAHYVHRMRGDEARMMTGLRASALPDDTLALQPGQAYLFDTKGNIRKVATPLMTPADLARVAQALGAAPSAPPSTPRPLGFRAPSAEGRPEGATEGAKAAPLPVRQDAPGWTAEELRIVAALASGKKPGELAEELSGAKGGRRYQEAAEKIAAVIARLAVQGRAA